MQENQTESFRCAHYASKYLPLTENWIYRILINHRQYNPIFLSRKKDNLALFPISGLYSLDSFGKLRQYLEILFFKLSGYFYFFKKICRDHQTQILHVHFGYHGVKMTGLKKTLGIPMVCSFYGDDVFAFPRIGNNKKKYLHLFEKADKILALGPYMRSELVRLGCPESKISIHHLGIDVNAIRFEKRTVSKGTKIRFLIASSFLEKKGIDLAIQALSQLKDQYDFSLDIIGDGPLKEQLVKAMEDGGIRDRITLHGYRPYAYFIDLAYTCHVFIQASRTARNNSKEGTPMAIVDAMATGMAIVSTEHSDIPEIVKDGEHGYLAPENDPIRLKSCLQKIMDHPEQIEVFSVKGRDRVEKEFNAKTQVQRLEAYYTELIAKNT